MSSTAAMEIPSEMKAIVVRELGGSDKLLYETKYPVPKLSPGQVLVKNEYAGLNFIDTYYRSGLYKQPLPFVSGGEGGGTVVAVAEDGVDTTRVQVGDKVVYMALGSYCEYTAVPANKLVKVPSTITMETALACMIQGLTAHYLVTDATAGLISPGEWCLIYSVGSGTCQWAAQMAKLQGYKVIGTTSSSKVDVVSKDAVDELIVLGTAAAAAEGDESSTSSLQQHSNYQSVDIVAKVMEITNGEGVKLIVDGIGKVTKDISIQCLALRGIWISFGNASGAVPPFSILELSAKSAFVTRPKLGDYVATAEELDTRAQQVFDWIQTGKVSVKVDKVFSIEQASQGHDYIESGQTKGKILFQIKKR